MAGAIKRISGPAYLSNTAVDIYTPPNSAVYVVINQIHIANTDSVAHMFTLYIGATGGSTGGTELARAVSVAPNTVYDLYWNPGIKMISTDFLTGLADGASKLTITVLGSYQAS